MTILALFFHADLRVRDRYDASNVDLRFVNRPGLSSAYRRYVRDVRRRYPQRPTLDAIAIEAGAAPISHYSHVVVATFSAGYGAAEALLDDSRVDGLVSIDSWHAPEGVPPASIAALVDYCRRNDVVARIGHTDVATYGYASTTEVARAVADAIDDDGTIVRGYDQEASDHDEHVNALTGWGPALFSEVVDLVRDLPSRDPLVVAPDLWADADLPLSLRRLAWVGYQIGDGVAEIPGSRHDPRILAYSEHCRRGGTFIGVDDGRRALWDGGTPLPLGRDEDPWCAAGASASLLAALLPSDDPPHGLRVSVRELVADARDAGTYRDRSYRPEPGDLAIESRAGQRPTLGGRGHVRHVVRVVESQYFGIGANERNRWVTDWHPLKSPACDGWITY